VGALIASAERYKKSFFVGDAESPRLILSHHGAHVGIALSTFHKPSFRRKPTRGHDMSKRV